MISIFSSCLVLISHYQNLLNDKLQFNQELINSNNSAFEYFQGNMDLLRNPSGHTIDVFDQGISSMGKLKNWGCYTILSVQTIFKSDTVKKTSLLGIKENGQNAIALYMPDHDNILKVSGKTEILGNIKVPKGKVETSYINGKLGNSISIKGNKTPSDKRLPPIQSDFEWDISSLRILSERKLYTDKNLNPFDKESILVDLNSIPILKNVNLKGNYILRSIKSVTLTNSCVLEDVLLMAPEVFIESGFTGNLQIMADRIVELDKDVRLKYPSGIYIKNETDTVNVKIGKGSIVAGAVIVDGNSFLGNEKRLIEIDSLSSVIGTVYCKGATQLNGEVIGSLYTDRFKLQTASSQYENVLLSAKINRDSLPQTFVGVGIFAIENETKKYDVIKKL